MLGTGQYSISRRPPAASWQLPAQRRLLEPRWPLEAGYWKLMIYLVHHADAVPPNVDAMRPLSDRGRAAAQLLAFDASRLGVRPESIWHSGKLRSRQTAEIFWRACNPFASLSVERGLQPTDPPQWMRDRFFGETRELMAVGHMPNIARLLRILLGGEDESSDVGFPMNGMVALEPKDERWAEAWRLKALGPGP